MSKFQVGDRVRMPGVPLIVEVIAIDTCDDGDSCHLDEGAEIFQFKDPGGLGHDWAHSGEFELVERPYKVE
jgi:hypothetical protein